MPLEDLQETIETLQERIREHRALLGQNEIRTRYALIDPLLRALGWDTENPSEVVPEQDASGGRADYALLVRGQPEVMVEAKKLGTALEGAVKQGVMYCLDKGTRYFAVTDGQYWAIYDTRKHGPLLERVVTEFEVGSASAKASLKALALWRPNVEGAGEENLTEAEEPLLGEQESTPPPPIPTAGSPSGTGQAAADLVAFPSALLTPEDLGRGRSRSKPVFIVLPSGEQFQLSRTTWVSFITELVQWLVNSGRVSESDVPLQRGKRYLLALTPVHPTGKPFKRGTRAGRLHIETDFSGESTVQNACAIIEHAGMDPAQFKVQF